MASKINYQEKLRDPSTMIVFSYALTGLGHLRVTDALYHGLPEGSRPLTLHSQDDSISYIHRIMSINRLTRNILQWTQQGITERLFTSVYRAYLRWRTDELKKQVLTLLSTRFETPKHVVFVTTHFFLSHQLAEIKKDIEHETGMKVSVVVQVTDDSPQKFWYVPGADLTVVPSHSTRKALEHYGRESGLSTVKFAVSPYPISPFLASICSKGRYKDRMAQLFFPRNHPVHISLPVSGAAVGLNYFKKIVTELHVREPRFRFHITSKEAPFTKSFLVSMRRRHYVNVVSSDKDKEVVNAYEMLFQEKTIALEITKPSEQAFKTLATPVQNGGAIMLFSTPVGRQEFDNIDFMQRHWLLPTPDEKELLWDMARNDVVLDDTSEALFSKIRYYRGVRIPKKSEEAVSFIYWCFKRGLFERMGRFEKPPLPKEHNHDDELGADGVKRFWEIVAREVIGSI